jgi:aryl-alcohol dehydrogenase-like predicted oxidoreductase
MQYRTLGRTGLQVSAVSMGTWKSFDVRGQQATQHVSALVTEALRRGVNLFDTAPMYGAAESVLGQALRGRREGVVIATKVLAHDRRSARVSIEESFHKLQVDVIDLLQIHNLAAWQEVTPTLEEYKTKGRVRFLGVTDYRTNMFPELMRAMRTGVFDAIQIPYNLGDRVAEREVLPLARALTLGVLVMTPLCPIFDRARLLRVLHRHDLTFLKPYGVQTPGQALLKYVLTKTSEAILLPATARLERVRENTEVVDNPSLPDEAVRQLEAFFTSSA